MSALFGTISHNYICYTVHFSAEGSKRNRTMHGYSDSMMSEYNNIPWIDLSKANPDQLNKFFSWIDNNYMPEYSGLDNPSTLFPRKEYTVQQYLEFVHSLGIPIINWQLELPL